MDMCEKIDSNITLIRQHIQNVLTRMRSKEAQLNAIQESLAEQSKGLDLMRKSVEERVKKVEKKEKELKDFQSIWVKDLEVKKEAIKGREEKLNEQEKLIQGVFEKIELERGKIEGIQKFIDGRFDEISQKERILDEKLERYNEEIQLRENSFSSREKELVAREKELEAREKFLSSKMEQIYFKEKLIEFRKIIWDLKTPEKDVQEAESEDFKRKRGRTKEEDFGSTEKVLALRNDLNQENDLVHNGIPKSSTKKSSKRGRALQNEMELKVLYLKTEEVVGKTEDFDTSKGKDSKFKRNRRGGRRGKKNHEPVQVHCPSPRIYTFSEFYDFEKDRKVYFPGQIWACYNEVDGMPRTYVTILEKSAQGLKGGTLVFDPTCLEIDRKGKDFPSPGCGKFINEGSEIISNPGDKLSHQMVSESCSSVEYLIYPRNGEIWALFKAGEIGSSFSGSYKYEIVEVLSDFAESSSIRVTYLKKIRGYLSIFEKTTEGSPFSIWPNELFKFSHRICAYQMNGTEREGISKGSFELDPAALPGEFC
ncbi:hypothetical protein M9H77_06821 [Catharanthus roseus]|uniref:Uncharacterized protein n=1 Tax=Catharanthus roseus TaxID=4058 RepID=A0ACC0BT65_CATRO|nr:hypothetical protein M9H77_06821 [Catharanthus roseus]